MKRFILFGWIFFTLAGLCFGQIELQAVAIVRLSKTEQITVKQFKEYVNWLSISKAMTTRNANAQLTETERRQALDELSNQFLACQAAEQEKITVTDREINQYFDQSIKNFSEGLGQMLGHAPTEAEIDTNLQTRTGMSRGSYRELMRRTLITENYLRIKKKALFDGVKPPEETEIQTVYNEVKGKSIFENGFTRPDTARVRMLMVPIRSAGEKSAAQTTANNLARQIGNDAGRFDEAARDFRKPNSGYLSVDSFVYKHERIRQALGANLVDTVFALKQGEVSRLVERPDGFYIIKVMETYRGKVLGLDDIYNLEDPESRTVRQTIGAAEVQRRFMLTLQQASEELVADLRKRGSVQVLDETYAKITW
ncbi:MAG: peptidyl-prolyl cis-trans isomerase [Spirochaetaceae bacterium]|jgi:parvulin-like peptidyl-prolyl isomerase|nr:peptidyl-prolyl cis-trans isomerase [Spirochaetaceae bacterium]